MPVPLHLLMMCHVLVRHQKHYNVSSMFAVNIHVNGVSALMQKIIVHITVLTKPTREKPDI